MSNPHNNLTAAERKAIPLARGLLDYFPDALMAVAELSQIGNEQHNPGQPLHWAKEKSTDEADALLRHLIDRGHFDTDGVRHSAKVAWRALALLQRELDAAKAVNGAIRLQPLDGMDAMDFQRNLTTAQIVTPDSGFGEYEPGEVDPDGRC